MNQRVPNFLTTNKINLQKLFKKIPNIYPKLVFLNKNKTKQNSIWINHIQNKNKTIHKQTNI